MISGKKLRKLRQMHKLSMQQLSDKTGISPSIIGHYERGDTGISDKYAMILESTLQGMTDDANDKKVRSELRQLRRDAGLSVDDISIFAGISPGCLGAYERGETRASMEKNILIKNAILKASKHYDANVCPNCKNANWRYVVTRPKKNLLCQSCYDKHCAQRRKRYAKAFP